MKAVSFTGHRPEQLDGYDKSVGMNVGVCNFLYDIINRLRVEGYRKFISGGALGVDQWAAETVLEFPDNELIFALPFADYGENWPIDAQQALAELKKKAKEVVVVCEGKYFENGKPQHWKNFKRNDWMKDNSDIVVAVYNGDEEGGTASAVRHAKKAGKRIIRYNPITKQEEPA